MSILPNLDYPFPDLPAPGTTLELAPGVRWLRMPLPFALDHSNLWLLDDGDALVAVDTGYDGEDVRQHWEQILGADGRPFSRLVVTHCHPDHLGLAAWLARRDGAPILMTQGEFLGGHALWQPLPGFDAADLVNHYRRHGLDEAHLEALAQRGNAYRRGVPALPSRYRRLFDGDRVPV